jgi:hypothetical protein
MDRANPPNPKGAFVCEAVGQVTGPGAAWGLHVSDGEQPRFLVFLSVSGTLSMAPGAGRGSRVLDPGSHPAINKGANRKGLTNRLMLVVCGRYLEIYVNNKAVCNPVRMMNEIVTPRVALLVVGTRQRGGTAEFESVLVAPAGVLPSLEERVAAVKGK